MTNVKYISSQDFDKAKLNRDGFSIIECIAKNNALLKIMESVLFKIKTTIPTPIAHFRIDIRNNPFIVEQFYVMQEPSYLIFFNGDFIDRIEGIISFTELSIKMKWHIERLVIQKQA